MVIVHYVPWLLFCQIDLLKGWFSRLKFGKLKKNSNSDSPTDQGDSPTRQVGESPALRLAEFSFKHSKAESKSRRLAESGSRFLITNISAISKPKPERLEK